MKEYTDSGCIDIVSAAFKKCKTDTSKIEEIKTRAKFVNMNDEYEVCIFDLWCEADDHDADSLRHYVALLNHRLIKKHKIKV